MGASLVDQEQFGPVLPIIRYHDLDDAIAQANRVEVGLSASVWSPDIEKARDVAARLGTEGLKAVTQPQIIRLKKTPQ